MERSVVEEMGWVVSRDVGTLALQEQPTRGGVR